MKGSIMMCDYWVHEILGENQYQTNVIYFDAGDIVPSSLLPGYGCVKSDQSVYLYTYGISYTGTYNLSIAELPDIYLIKKYYGGIVAKTREWYLGEYKF